MTLKAIRSSSIITALLIIHSVSVTAQQDPLLSHYLFNKLDVNPGYAGSREALCADILYRYQWVNIDGSPRTFSASLHSPLRNDHIGLGLNIYQDVTGPDISQGALATFAYRILFKKSKLSFGLQTGMRHSDILWSRIVTLQSDDPAMRPVNQNITVPDAGFGIYYYSGRFYAGLSAKHLFKNEISKGIVEGIEHYTQLSRHYYGIAGGAIPVGNELVFCPSLLVKYVRNSPLRMDLNASFIISRVIRAGISYRTEKAVSLMTEVMLTRNLRLGYTYDQWFNELLTANKGSHEFRLGVDLDVFVKTMLTPVYF